jgi:hypothetical protein
VCDSACRECAAYCEEFTDDTKMKACAAVCHRCAESCRAMVDASMASARSM